MPTKNGSKVPAMLIAEVGLFPLFVLVGVIVAIALIATAPTSDTYHV